MKKYFYIATLFVVVIGGFFIYKFFFSAPDISEQYKLEKIKIADITQMASANGTLNPVTVVNVGTQVSGTVVKIFADYNSRVKQNQILAELDPVIFQAQLAQSNANLASSNANLELAEANFKRSLTLFEKGYISKQEFDSSNQALKAAKASVDLAKAQVKRDSSNLNFSIIKSPVSGVVIDRQIDVGQTVAASFQTPTLFKIAKDLRKMQIDSNFAEADIGRIKEGQKAIFTVDAYPNKSFEGNVTQIRLSPTIQQNVVTYDVVISVENQDETLKPGMTAFVSVIIGEAKNTLVVPNAALRFKPADFKRDATKLPKGQKPMPNIYVLKDGIPVAVKVTLGLTDGKFTQITSDSLKEGDEIIVSGPSAPKSGHMRPPMM